MKLGDILEKMIYYLTFGQGKKIASWIAKKLGYESCNCESRKKALNNIYRLLEKGGHFYFSVPMGVQKIYFNAHRVYSLTTILEMFKDRYKINSFGYIDDNNELVNNVEITPELINKCDSFEYGCCLFDLIKI